MLPAQQSALADQGVGTGCQGGVFLPYCSAPAAFCYSPLFLTLHCTTRTYPLLGCSPYTLLPLPHSSGWRSVTVGRNGADHGSAGGALKPQPPPGDQEDGPVARTLGPSLAALAEALPAAMQAERLRNRSCCDLLAMEFVEEGNTVKQVRP